MPVVTKSLQTGNASVQETAMWFRGQLLFPSSGHRPNNHRDVCVTRVSSLLLNEFNVALRPQRPYGRLGKGSPGRPPRLLHSS